jgi:hypothetical protein
LLHARPASGNEGELGCDEKAVGEHEEDYGKERYAGTNWVLQTRFKANTSGPGSTGHLLTIAMSIIADFQQKGSTVMFNFEGVFVHGSLSRTPALPVPG